MPVKKTGGSIKDSIPSAGKTSSAAKKTTTAKKATTVPKKTTTAANKTAAVKKTASTVTKTAGTTAARKTTDRNALVLTAAEKKLVLLYREADQAAKEKCIAILKGEETDILGGVLSGAGELLGNLVGPALENILNPKR